MKEEQSSKALSAELMVNGQSLPKDQKRKLTCASSLKMKDAQQLYPDQR
jgi:hypothetical protein